MLHNVLVLAANFSWQRADKVEFLCFSVLQLYAEAEKRQKMAKRKDYYKILAVDQSASSRDIKSVSKGVCRMWNFLRSVTWLGGCVCWW